MKWIFFTLILLQNGVAASAQTLPQTLNSALENLGKDEQFAHSMLGIYVTDVSNGKIIFQKNAQVGLAAASCQKVITSASAFSLLGGQFRFGTFVATDGPIRHGSLEGNIIIKGSGDPSLGSWRWSATTQASIDNRVRQALVRKGIRSISGRLVAEDLKYKLQPVPDGWIWQDIGNYYGAGAWSLNWNENQYDLHLRSPSREGDRTEIIKTTPFDIAGSIQNSILSGPPGSGDNGYLYAAPFSKTIFAMGTIPAGQKDFVISGSLPDPAAQFSSDLSTFLNRNNIHISGEPGWLHQPADKQPAVSQLTVIDSIFSPVLDSLNYWFLKKSINLYGESFVKEMGFQEKQEGSTISGLNAIKEFWQTRGISPAEINLMDGSGLSPANRVTCHALVTVMEYARRQEWFDSFYKALPEMNGIKMKDGYINGVRSYTGFIKSKSGKTYCFAFIVNNFTGNPGSVREKMWKVLDLLK